MWLSRSIPGLFRKNKQSAPDPYKHFRLCLRSPSLPTQTRIRRTIMQVHAVPDHERHRDSTGHTLPWAYAFAELAHSPSVSIRIAKLTFELVENRAQGYMAKRKAPLAKLANAEHLAQKLQHQGGKKTKQKWITCASSTTYSIGTKTASGRRNLSGSANLLALLPHYQSLRQRQT